MDISEKTFTKIVATVIVLTILMVGCQLVRAWSDKGNKLFHCEGLR